MFYDFFFDIRVPYLVSDREVFLIFCAPNLKEMICN